VSYEHTRKHRRDEPIAHLCGIRLSYSQPLVRLQRGAAGAELDRLRAGVFELGAGVRVDELTGLDPLEAVTF